MLKNNDWSYPDKQLNGKAIIDPIQILDLSITTIGSYQKKGYDFVLDSLRKEKPILNDPNKGLLFTILEPPLQALNMIYPHYELDSDDANDADALLLLSLLSLLLLFLFDNNLPMNLLKYA